MHITPAWCEEQFGTQLRAFAADLHSHPELSFEETRTTQKILQALQSLPGVEVLATGAKTGAVARLAGGEGPAVALRADIDAIPQHEAVQRPDASVYEGKMHACGHDTHTASLLGAAMALCRRKSALRGDVYFVFQPAEEALSGAKYLVEQCGLFQAIHPAAMFGLHNYPELPLGTVGVKQGQLMSYKDVFEMRFVGRSGHSSMPQKNIDPIVAAAAFIQSVQTITSRNVGPLEAAVVSICQVHAGTPRNLVVDDVLLSGNIRTLDEAVRARAAALRANCPRHGRCLRVPAEAGYAPHCAGREQPRRAVPHCAGRGRGLAGQRGRGPAARKPRLGRFFHLRPACARVLLFSGLRRAGAAAVFVAQRPLSPR